MKNKSTLLVVTTLGENPPVKLALVPSQLLSKYPLDDMHGVILNVTNDISDEAGEAIMDLYKRLGLEKDELQSDDLSQYLNPEPPLEADRVVCIGWSV